MLTDRKFVDTVLLLVLAACSTPQTASIQTATTSPSSSVSIAKNSSVQKTYDDPFAYCAAVGTIDAPDARYTGPHTSDEIINGYKIAAGLTDSTEPMEMLKKMTIWRCMNNQVYVCNFGANLPRESVN